QAGPFRLGLDRVPCHQVHDSLRLTRSSWCQPRSIKCDSCLRPLGCPSEVRFETACVLKVGNMPDGRKNRCGSKRIHRRNGEQNFPLSALLHNLTDFSLKPLQMILDQTQFLDEQLLFKQKAPLASEVLCSNALRGKLLQQHPLGGRRENSFSSPRAVLSGLPLRHREG